MKNRNRNVVPDDGTQRSRRFDPRTVLTNLPSIGFAFNDDPNPGAAEGGGGVGSGTPAAPGTAPATPPAEPPAFNPDDYVSKDRVGTLIQDSKAQAKRSALAEVNTTLEGLGFSGGLEGLQQSVAQQQQAERERLEKANEYKTLYEQTTAEKDQIIAEKDAALQRTIKAHQDEKLTNSLMAAAQDTVNPQQVATLIRDRVRVDDQGKPYVIDDLGARMTDGNGNVLTVEGYVERFLDANPYFRKPAAGRGTTTTQSGNNPPPPPRQGGNGEVDLDRAASDPKYMAENRDAIEHMIRTGQIG